MMMHRDQKDARQHKQQWEGEGRRFGKREGGKEQQQVLVVVVVR